MKKLFFNHGPILVLLIAGAVWVSGCTKDPAPDPVTPPPPASGKKLSKIEYDGGSYESIEYNTNGSINRITNHIQFSTGTPLHTVYGFVYTANVLSELRGDDGSKYKYTYNNNQVVKTEIYAANGSMVAYYEYTYTNGKLTRTDGYAHIPGGGISPTPSFRYDQEYLSSGNLKKMVLYFKDPQTGLLEKTNEYLFPDFDTKQNTSALFENNPYLPMTSYIPNNPLSETHFDANGSVEETVIHSYTYDSDGNPLTRKSVTKTTGFPDQVENTRFYY